MKRQTDKQKEQRVVMIPLPEHEFFSVVAKVLSDGATVF